MIRFDQFVIDTECGCLRTSHDREVRLRPKSFDVLCYLAVNGGRLVSKQEMLQAIWPRVVVGDESLAQCVSEIRQAIGDKGQQIIRTVPRRGYRFVATVHAEDGTAALPAAAAAPEATEPGDCLRGPSIAVLPFIHLGGTPQQEYFSDGITEDIIAELSRFSELTVIARSSSFQYKGCAVDVRRVGRELDVRYVLEGSVRREGDRVRLLTQLADAATGTQLWAERYERRIDDLFSLQDELAQSVASVLAVQIRNAEGRGVLRRPPATWSAYDLYLRAAEAYRARGRSQAAVLQAQGYAEQSLTADPQFARAYALLSKIHWWQYAEPLNGRYLQQDTLAEAHELARHAVQLDAASPDAHSQLGWTSIFSLQHESGIAEFEQAFALNRNFVDNRYALALTYAGQPAQALQVLHASLPIDPFQPFDGFGFTGHAHFMLGDHAEAARLLSVYPSRAPAVRILPLWLAAACAMAGDVSSARKEAAEVLRLEPGFAIARWRATAVYKNTDDTEHLLEGLRRAGLPQD